MPNTSSYRKMENQEIICRLCFKICDNEFKVIEETASKILASLLEINLRISEEAVMCTNCTESLKQCSDFKSRCVDAENFIVQFCNHKGNNTKLDLKDIYLSKEPGNDFPEDHEICRLCMCPFKISSFMPSVSEEGNVIQEKIMLEKCVPELDLRITEKPVICVPCHESLQHYFSFMTNSSIIEKNIKKYCEAAGLDDTNIIKLKDVVEFTTKNIPNEETSFKTDDKLCKDEQKCSTESLCISKNISANEENGDKIDSVKVEEIFCDESDIKIELKTEILVEMNDQRFDDVPTCMLMHEEGGNQVDVIEMKHSHCQEKINDFELKNDNFEEMLEQKFICDREVEMKTEQQYFDSIQDSDMLPQTETNINTPKSQECLVVQPHKTLLQVKKYINEPGKSLSLEKNSSKRTMHQCESCSYQTRYKQHLKRHMWTHDPKEVIMYQCDFCSYQTKHKHSLKTHMMIHKSPSRLVMHRCEVCSYRTNQKNNLARHLLIHKNPSEITMYRCEHCSFQTKRKNAIVGHLFTHKSPSENPSKGTAYQCASCSFETKYKRDLIRHLLIHKNPSEIPMYRCELCSFQTKYKHHLKAHLVIHKNPSEVTMYHCEFCAFQTKRKNNLVRHFLIHKNPSELPMFQCEHCSFQTKYKDYLKLHLLSHKESFGSNAPV